MPPPLRIQLLGAFRLVYGEESLMAVNEPRLQSFLTYLLLNRGAPQSRPHVAFLLWPDSTEGQARTNLRVLLHLLREALPDSDSFLYTDGLVIQWRPDAPFSLDVADFECALAGADLAERAADQVAVTRALTEAVTLYRDDLLPSCYDEWILPERERLRGLFGNALERLIALLEAQREYSAAIHWAQRLVQHDPLSETSYRQLMHLQELSGDRATALRTYHTCATVLQRELGVEPDASTRQVYQRLLNQEAKPGAEEVGPAPLVALPPLVGRGLEMARLRSAWESVIPGGPSFVVITGEAGIGKTRLAEELVNWVSRQGITTAVAHGYLAEGSLAYAPVTSWLRTGPLRATLSLLPAIWLTEVIRLLPELVAEYPDLPQPGDLKENWQRQRFFDAIAQAILQNRQALLLLLDDMQWCDRETLEWVHFLLRFKATAKLLVVGTLRAEEVAADHPVAALLQALRGTGQVTEIELGPLGKEETTTLGVNVAGRSLEPDMTTRLYEETEGNPLFVVETVRAGMPVNRVPAEVQTEDLLATGGLTLPSRVHAVIRSRLTQLSPPAERLVNVAATIGRSFTIDVLMRASGGDEDSIVRGLDELWRRRIVREHGADAYDFSHDKLRAVAYASLSLAKRRHVHRRVGEALETVYGSASAAGPAQALDAVSGQIAAHYERAGLPERAIPYYQRAADVARRVYANKEAIKYLRRALALVDALSSAVFEPDRRSALSAQLSESLGDVLQLAAQHAEAKVAYQNAMANAAGSGAVCQARLHRKLGNTWVVRRRGDEALQSYQLAAASLELEIAQRGPQWWQEWIQIQLERMWTHYWMSHWPEISTLAEQTRPIAEQYGTRSQRISFFMSLNSMYALRDCYAITAEMLDLGRTALAISLEGDDPSEIAWAQFGLGMNQLFHGDLDEAETNMQAALVLAKRIGDPVHQSRCLTYLTILYRKRGQVDVVREISIQSLDVATSAGMVEYVGTARANQAWVAWRETDLAGVQIHGQAALDLWRQLPSGHPSGYFQWTALWPLISTALAQQQFAGAVDYARQLLGPARQRLPEPLVGEVEAAIQASEMKRSKSAGMHLRRAVELAISMGYL